MDTWVQSKYIQVTPLSVATIAVLLVLCPHVSHVNHLGPLPGLVAPRRAPRFGAQPPVLPLAEPSQHCEPKGWVLRQQTVEVAQVNNLLAVTVSPYHTD